MTGPGNYDVVIIGAGPAGLFCALHAVDTNRSVIILEKKETCGKKLLITGAGQCNLTHSGDIREFLPRYGDNGKFLRPALFGFTNKDLIEFFENRGLTMVTDDNLKVFPATRKASDVLTLLITECKRRGVTVRCNEAVLSVGLSEGRFSVKTKNGHYNTPNVVISTGGMSYPVTGSSGDGYRFAEGLDQPITEIRPGLSAVYVRDYPFSHLSGLSFENIVVSLFRDNKKIHQSAGDLLFTHLGLSGPVILHLSRSLRAGDRLKISFVPGMDREKVLKNLIEKTTEQGKRQLKRILLECSGLPERFVKELLELAGIPADSKCAHISKKARNTVIDYLTAFPFDVESCGGFNEAMVTVGGVSLNGINSKTMESKSVSGLYFIGEVLDIDGDTGGYNLQAAFSTAYAAAKAIGSEKRG